MSRIKRLIVSSLVLVVAACTTSRQAGRIEIVERNLAEVITVFNENRLDYKTISGRAAIRYKDNDHALNLTLNFKIVKDSAIWMSFSPILGIEVSRVLLTRDSLKWLDRLNNRFYAGDYNRLSQIACIQIDYEILQCLLTATPQEEYRLDDFQGKRVGNQYHFFNYTRRAYREYQRKADPGSHFILQDVWIDMSDCRISKVRIKETLRNKISVEVDYKGYLLSNGLPFPSGYNITAKSDGDILISGQVERIAFNENVTMQFRIPDRYIPIRLDP